jgi:hypothetical protein
MLVRRIRWVRANHYIYSSHTVTSLVVFVTSVPSFIKHLIHCSSVTLTFRFCNTIWLRNRWAPSKGLIFICYLHFYFVLFFWLGGTMKDVEIRIILLTSKNFFNLLRPSSNFTYHRVYHSQILCSAHIAFMCFVRISEQTAAFAL